MCYLGTHSTGEYPEENSEHTTSDLIDAYHRALTVPSHIRINDVLKSVIIGGYLGHCITVPTGTLSYPTHSVTTLLDTFVTPTEFQRMRAGASLPIYDNDTGTACRTLCIGC